MLAKVISGTINGLDGVMIEVEVDVANRGFPTFTIVGLPDKAVDEAKDRVRTAIINASFDMPDSRITVNLAPADIPKYGSAFDLPIAVGILAASGMIQKTILDNSLFIGELSLEGKVRQVPGIVSMVMMAKEQKIANIFVPFENIQEASIIDDIKLYPVARLLDIILHCNGQKLIELYSRPASPLEAPVVELDFADIKGQEAAKRALEIAASGFHNLHLKGPPGAGKTMLSRAFPSILPPLQQAEMLEVIKIYSAIGQTKDRVRNLNRPFRSPHHTTSRMGLIGGGTHPIPGEISLAHRGVLFLDEFPEFPRSVLEALRQPLEDGTVTISRAAGSLTFPSRFILLAASNPCPCGYAGHPKKNCKCLPGLIMRYRKRLSGPMLDRIDLHINVPPVEEEKLMGLVKGEASVSIQRRVMQAKSIQTNRFQQDAIHSNGEMTSAHIKKYCHLTVEAQALLKQAMMSLSLSARAYFKTIKVAQTIADLANSNYIEAIYIAEALQYRAMDE